MESNLVQPAPVSLPRPAEPRYGVAIVITIALLTIGFQMSLYPAGQARVPSTIVGVSFGQTAQEGAPPSYHAMTSYIYSAGGRYFLREDSEPSARSVVHPLAAINWGRAHLAVGSPVPGLETNRFNPSDSRVERINQGAVLSVVFLAMAAVFSARLPKVGIVLALMCAGFVLFQTATTRSIELSPSEYQLLDFYAKKSAGFDVQHTPTRPSPLVDSSLDSALAAHGRPDNLTLETAGGKDRLTFSYFLEANPEDLSEWSVSEDALQAAKRAKVTYP